ncbi:MAG: cytochrome c peroxidase [Bacteroidota bacterium]
MQTQISINLFETNTIHYRWLKSTEAQTKTNLKKTIIISSTAILCIIFVQLSFSKKNDPTIAPSPTFKPINTWYTAQADSFLLQLLVLQKLHVAKSGLPVFQKQFVKSRRAFKKMEMLISYFDARLYLGINSRVKQEVELSKGTYEYVAEPRGLQVMETYLEDDSTFKASRPAMESEINLAVSTARFLKVHHFTKPYTDTGFFNAATDEMIRIAALGITGFDKPVLEDAIPETTASLNGVLELVAIYQKANLTIPDLKKLEVQLILARQFIRNTTTNFDSFDRLAFIRNHLQPIFSLADKIVKQDLLQSSTTPVFQSFFQEDYIDQLYHQTSNYPSAVVTLGKALFESNALSANGQLSCTSCHKPGLDFADTVQRNTGLHSTDTVTRNTPSLLNAKYHLRFQMDGHALFMQDQFREVLGSHIEMGNISDIDLVKNIQADTDLAAQFLLSYGVPKDSISYSMTLDALEAFIRSLSGLRSRFDQYMTYQTKTITTSVKRGFNLFMGAGKCGTCHFMPVFNGVMPPYANKEDNEVIGVLKDDDFDNPILDKDEGLFAVTKMELHRNSFKVPTVRHLKKTAPYMHNGSLKNLDDLLIFYNVGGGGGWGFGLDVPNQTLDREPIRLNEKERNDLKAFLLSLD